MRVTIDRDACTGCGACADTCPEVFELDKEDIATVKEDPIPAECEDACHQAAEDCPTEAIIVEE